MTNAFSRWLKGWLADSDSAARRTVSPAASTSAVPSQPETASPAGRQRAPRPPYRRPLQYRPLFWLVLVVGSLGAGTASRGYRIWQTTATQLPPVDQLVAYERTGTITIQADDGTILQKIGPATHEKVRYADIPERLIDAFIAAEDRRFYEHNGLDYQAIARATLANLRQREVVEGASTITQQLARIIFLNQDQSFQRKVREALLALKISETYDKSVVLERYLNLVYLGAGAYGVADAAWVYFGKTVDELTLAESALIAGMAPAPSLYSPVVNPEAARQQRNTVIRRMLETGAITPAEAEAAIATEVAVTPQEPKYLYSEFPYFTIYIQRQLGELLSPDVIERGGLIVETTLNVDWQRKAEATIQEAVETLGQRQRFSQAALVAIDPRSGEIKAIVGGTDFEVSQFNRATQAYRQPGSTFKTFVYTAAIAAGFSPYKTYADAKFIVDGYEPENYDDTYRGTVSMRRALTSSVNIVAVKVLIDVGFDPIIEIAQRMGIQSELRPTYSLALGASEVTLLELTSAYGTLAHQGQHVPAHGIRRVVTSAGEVVYEADTTPTQAVDAETAAIVTWMLQGVVEGGTGRRANLGRPVAGKTGTSENDRDLWFVGYLPQLVVGVWLGNDDNSRTWGVSSSAAYTWRQFVSQLLDELPPEDFPPLPELANREGSIEADPVQPKKVVAAEVDPADEVEAETVPPEAETSGTTTEETGTTAEEAASPADGAPADQTPDEPAAPPPAAEDAPAAPAPAPAPVPAPAPAPAPAPVPAPAPDPLPAPAPAPAPESIPNPAPAEAEE